MKQIYKIGTLQYFTYTIPSFFKKNRKVQEYWVVRNVWFIYANSEDEAKEKYKDTVFYTPKEITLWWGDWYGTSDGVNIHMKENWIDITSTDVLVINYDNRDVKYDKLKEHMLAEDFRDWWFDNGRCNQIPE